MAIMTPGPTVGQVSGRIGGIVYSRNRGGAYIRNGAIPTRSTTPYAQAAKARLALFSADWATLSAVQQQAWKTWASQNPVTNRLGMQITLSPHAAFVRLNTTIDIAGGTPILIPPVVAPPAGLISLSATYDIGAGNMEMTFTPTPLAGNQVLFVDAAVSDNPGVKYVQNLYKQILISAGAQTSPLNFQTELTTRFGTLQVDQQVFLSVSVVDQDTGLRSGPQVTNGVIIST